MPARHDTVNISDGDKDFVFSVADGDKVLLSVSITEGDKEYCRNGKGRCRDGTCRLCPAFVLGVPSRPWASKNTPFGPTELSK